MNKPITQEEKKLLLQDLCTRLPYKPYVEINDSKDWYFGNLLAIEVGHDKLCGTITNSIAIFEFLPERVKPYLRPKSSMTEEEKIIYQSKQSIIFDFKNNKLYADNYYSLDYLNSIYVDYRGLIEKGLASEAPEGMYNL